MEDEHHNFDPDMHGCPGGSGGTLYNAQRRREFLAENGEPMRDKGVSPYLATRDFHLVATTDGDSILKSAP
jgi:hypothetical protein